MKTKLKEMPSRVKAIIVWRSPESKVKEGG